MPCTLACLRHGTDTSVLLTDGSELVRRPKVTVVYKFAPKVGAEAPTSDQIKDRFWRLAS